MNKWKLTVQRDKCYHSGLHKEQGLGQDTEKKILSLHKFGKILWRGTIAEGEGLYPVEKNLITRVD